MCALGSWKSKDPSLVTGAVSLPLDRNSSYELDIYKLSVLVLLQDISSLH